MAAILATNLSSAYEQQAKPLCRLLGYLHDILKDTAEFQGRLNRGGGAKSEITRHTGGGAWIGFIAARIQLEKDPCAFGDWGDGLNPWLPRIAFSVIAAHHSRLKRIDVLTEHRRAIDHWLSNHSRVSQELLQLAAPDVTLEEIEVGIQHTLNETGDTDTEITNAPSGGRETFSLFLLCRLLLGALGKADVQSAFRQERGIKEPDRFTLSFDSCRFTVGPTPAPRNRLDELRTYFQQSFVESATRAASGVIRLKAPTGLGKTLAAALWVEKIQLQSGPSKVFYLAPTTAILNQVYEDLRTFAEPGNTLILHHLRQERSDEEDSTTTAEDHIRRIIDFDCGQIVTTFHRAVRMLCDLSKTGCGVLQSLKGSIWIFDESQALSYRQFALMALLWQTLSDYCGATILFMSATPQSIGQWQQIGNSLEFQNLPSPRPGLSAAVEDSLSQHPLVNDRRSILARPEIRTVDELAQHLNAQPELRQRSLLILVNLARDAMQLAALLEEPPDYIISGFLRPIDIRTQLTEASGQLKEGKTICMIATSVVQAGVDLDFDNGFVELNDLRDFRQGCGRIGRNLNPDRPQCVVWCFELWKDRATKEQSWFRQRFKREQETENKPSAEVQIEIVRDSISKILQRPDSFTDSDVDQIEAGFHPHSGKVFEHLKERLTHWNGTYSNLLCDTISHQGFDFSLVTEILEADLGVEDDAYIVVFESQLEDEYQHTIDLLHQLDDLENQRNRGDLSPLDYVRQANGLRQDIYRHIAPFSLRRPDVLRHFLANTKTKHVHKDFDFYLAAQLEAYDPKKGGYLLALDSVDDKAEIF